MPYIGRTLGQGTRSRFLYTATAGQTTFSGSDTQSNTLAYADNNGLDCFQNGVLLKGGGADYTATTGTSVVLTTGASVNDVIEILVYDVFAIADHVKKSGDAMTGALSIEKDGNTSLTVNRLTSDGDIIDLQKDGSTVGSIGVSGTRMHLLNGDTGLRFAGDTNSIFPCTTAGADSDNAIDFGASGNRFKDFYLGGGIYLGGTGSANHLDDYEEGIHNAVATTTDDTSTALGTGSEDALQYVKIGGMVYIHGSIAVGGASATGAIRVSLPFAPTSLSERADLSYFNVTLDAGDGGGGAAQAGQFIGEVNGAVGAEIRVYATDQLSFQSDSAQSMDASCSLGIMGFYYSS